MVKGASFLIALLKEALFWGSWQDKAYGYGFLHRLDVPGSGLVIAAKSYQAWRKGARLIWGSPHFKAVSWLEFPKTWLANILRRGWLT